MKQYLIVGHVGDGAVVTRLIDAPSLAHAKTALKNLLWEPYIDDDACDKDLPEFYLHFAAPVTEALRLSASQVGSLEHDSEDDHLVV
jgi:hypothetical protein